MKLSKIFLYLIALIILVAAGIAYYIFNNINDIVKQQIETHGSQAIGTAVQVAGVDIKITEGTGNIKQLTIANPEGYKSLHAFSLNAISIKLDLSQITDKLVIIDSLVIKQPHIVYESKQKDMLASNLTDIKALLNQSNAEKSSETNTAKTTEAKQTDSLVKIIVKKIEIKQTELSMDLASINNKSYNKVLPDLVINNIGGKQGVSPSEFSQVLMQKLIDTVIQQVKQAQKEKLKQKLKDKVEEKVDEKLKDLFKSL